MKVLALFALVALPAFAQTPFLVEVLAEKSQVVVGETLQVRAVVRDQTGQPIPGAVLTWAVNQPSMATISTSGLVSTRGLGTIRVTARSGSVTGEAAFQTIPLRLEVLGPDTLTVGSSARYSAFFYDVNGVPIPNVPLQWSLLNERQSTSYLGSINTTGSVTPTGEGSAWVWANYTYNETFPGLQQRWVAYTPVTINAPKFYNVSRVFSTLSKTRSTWTLRPKQSMLWPTDDGGLTFNASLSGLGNALVNWNGGVWKVISAGGMPRFGRASSALEFRTHSVTRDGQIFTYEDTSGNGTELNLGTVTSGVQSFLNSNVPLGGTEATSSLFITRNSLTSTGWKMVRAGFRFVNTTATLTGLFRGISGLDDPLINTGDKLAEISAGFNIDSDFGIAADGTAIYGVTNGAVRVFYRHDFNGRKKLLAVRDPIPGVGPATARVRNFTGGRTNAPATWFDEDGTAIFCVTLDDGSQWYVNFAPNGKITSLRLTSQTGILFRDPNQGTLIYANPYNNQGNGIYLWKDGAVKPVLLLNRKVFDQTVQDIESGAIDRWGSITLLVRGDTNALFAARMDEKPWLLFQSGDVVTADAPVDINTLLSGARAGPPHVMAGGNPGSIARFTNGDFDSTVAIGERFGTSTMWFGGSVGSLSNMRKAPNGDVYFITGLGIYRAVPGGAPQIVQSFPLRVDSTLTLNNPSGLDINSQGDILFYSSTSLGDVRFCILSNGEVRQILTYSPTLATATVLNGQTVSTFDSFFLADDGRVIAELRFRNLPLPSLAIWDGSNWTLAATPGTKLGNHTVTGFPNIIRASGNHLMAEMTVETGGNILAEWTGSDWRTLLDVTTIMPNGQNANSVNAAEINRAGDALFQFSNGINSIVVRKANGDLQQVQNLFRPTPEGDWLIRLVAMDFRDDGTVYFLAFNQYDELCLYQADPTA